MPLIENDIFYPYLANKGDPKVIKALHKIANGEIPGIYSSSLCLVELSLIYKSLDEEKKLPSDLVKLTHIPNIVWADLSAGEVVAAAHLREDYRLDFWDSHYAAVALNQDKIIISTDKIYDLVPAIKRFDPRTI